MANNWAFQIQLPEKFEGKPGEVIEPWFDRLEIAIRTLDQDGDVNERLRSLVPHKLSNTAYEVYASLAPATQGDYQLLKHEMCQVFNNDAFLRLFRDSLTARVRAPNEHIEVFVAQVRNLVRRAFPTYNADQQNAEVFRRILAGVDPILRSRALELNAVTVQDIIELAKNVERAQFELHKVGMGYNPGYAHPLALGVPQAQTLPATVATIDVTKTMTSNKHTDTSESLLKELVDKVKSLELKITNEATTAEHDRSRNFDRRRDFSAGQNSGRSFSNDRPNFNRSNSNSGRNARETSNSFANSNYGSRDYRPNNRGYDQGNRPYDGQGYRPNNSPYRYVTRNSRPNSPYRYDGRDQRSASPYYDNRNSRSNSPYGNDTRQNYRSNSPYPRGNSPSSRSGDRSPSPYRKQVKFADTLNG